VVGDEPSRNLSIVPHNVNFYHRKVVTEIGEYIAKFVSLIPDGVESAFFQASPS